jgi:hypothetical protein
MMPAKVAIIHKKMSSNLANVMGLIEVLLAVRALDVSFALVPNKSSTLGMFKSFY